MIEITDKTLCCGCSACVQICAKKCITLASDDEGFDYPVIDKNLCIDCNACKKVCPILNSKQELDVKTRAYVAYAKNEDMRLKSSSGGMFTLFAEHIIDQGGVVYGAAFDKSFMVHHICIEKKEDLFKLRGSKYLQSRIENTYMNAEEKLKSGRFVLYTGTACQIAGLKSYLRKDYGNLYTVDVLCHGVPSPLVWRKYKEGLEKKYDSDTKQMFFRQKNLGWKTYALEFSFKNSKTYIRKFYEDTFMKLFLGNICLRPSCHNCKFKNINRPSDITIGDCWGIENYMPEMDDNKGTSVVLVHSESGTSLFNDIKQCMEYKDAEIDRALPPSADSRKSVLPHKKKNKIL